ncbi:MAG: hypothetical protein AAGB46_06935 [Verrucomicrobiota bacterium]
MSILSKPWFLAVLALLLMLATQFAAFEISKSELLPKKVGPVVVHPADPKPEFWSFSPDEINQLRRELESRLAEVEERSQELDAFEARLNADRTEVEGIKASVMEMRDSLLQDIVRLEKTEEANLANLAKTYSALDAEDAVSILLELDDATVVKIMFFMKPDIQAEILGEMAGRDKGDKLLVQKAANWSDMLRLFSDEDTTGT